MRTIKTRTIANLKSIESVGGSADKMKQSFIKLKEQSKVAQGDGAQSEQEYSANQLTNMVEGLNPIGQAIDTAQRVPSPTRSTRTGETGTTPTRTSVSPQSNQTPSTLAYQKHQTKVQQQAALHSKMQTQGRSLAMQRASRTSAMKQTQAQRSSPPLTAQKASNAATRPRANRTMRNATILRMKQQQYKKSAKTAKKALKHSGKLLKGAHSTTTTVGVAKQGVSQSFVLGKRTFQRSAIALWKSTVLVAKTTKAVVVTAVVAAKSLIALCIAGGSLAVTVIVLIAMIGMLVASPMGIFFANDSSNTQSLSSVITMLHGEYDDELSEIKADVEHNLYQFEGENDITAPVWHEVLPIYAIQTASQNTADITVISVTDANIRLLRELFWDMHEISYRTEESERLVEVVYPDGEGGTYTEEVIVIDITLIITLSYKTADEMAAELGFSASQRAQLAELQSPQYDALWDGLIGGLTL